MKMHMLRRNVLKSGAVAVGALAASGILANVQPVLAASGGNGAGSPVAGKAGVYFTRDLSAEGLRKIYAAVNQGIIGKVAVKLHTGEPNGPNIIPREWVKALMPDLGDAAIVECNVLYPSPRQTTEGHRETIATNGWTFCPVDIMDADGDVPLPIKGGKRLQEVAVGKNITQYDSMVVLTHFKGHALGGFGGSLKNIAIGCASGRKGKAQLHGSTGAPWLTGPELMERMVEGGKAVTGHFGSRITYINVLRNMSVDCDCAGTRAAPVVTPDIGILASTDILAVDQASVDMVYALPKAQNRDLVERIESRSGLRQLSYMQEMGMGRSEYEIINV